MMGDWGAVLAWLYGEVDFVAIVDYARGVS